MARGWCGDGVVTTQYAPSNIGSVILPQSMQYITTKKVALNGIELNDGVKDIEAQ